MINNYKIKQRYSKYSKVSLDGVDQITNEVMSTLDKIKLKKFNKYEDLHLNGNKHNRDLNLNKNKNLNKNSNLSKNSNYKSNCFPNRTILLDIYKKQIDINCDLLCLSNLTKILEIDTKTQYSKFNDSVAKYAMEELVGRANKKLEEFLDSDE